MLKNCLDETDVNDYKLMELSEIFMDHQDDGVTLELELHKFASTIEQWRC